MAEAFLKKFIRNKHREKIGVIVGQKTYNGDISIGWSLCNRKDTFDKAVGDQIAIGRMLKGSDTPLPHAVMAEVDHLRKRCQAYFK